MNTAGVRAALGTAAAAISTTAALTVKAVFPDVPDELLVAWGGVFMAVYRVGEAILDARSGRSG